MTPYHEFYPGQQVVCIDDKVPLEGGSVVKDTQITEGEVYTLRSVSMASHYVFGEYLGVRLVGIVAKFGDAWGIDDCPFAARRFRPLVRDKLATFRSLAADGPIQGDFEEPKRGGGGESVPEREREREKEKV